MTMPRSPLVPAEVPAARGQRVGQFVPQVPVTGPLAALVRDAGRPAAFKVRALLGELANTGSLSMTGVSGTERQLVGEALRARLVTAQTELDPSAAVLAALVTQWTQFCGQ